MEEDPEEALDEEIDEEKESIPSFETVDAKIQNGKVLLPASSTSQMLFDKNYFGTQLESKDLELELVEALLLLERNRIKITSESGQPVSSQALLSLAVESDPKIWVKYLIYRDLRSRGYIVRSGYGDGIDYRVYPRGSTRAEGAAKYFIFILAEGDPIHLATLDKVAQQTVNARKQLIVAIIDRLGDPTYYELEQFRLSVNTGKKEIW
jgi:tRNA-intron endonuclease